MNKQTNPPLKKWFLDKAVELKVEIQPGKKYFDNNVLDGWYIPTSGAHKIFWVADHHRDIVNAKYISPSGEGLQPILLVHNAGLINYKTITKQILKQLAEEGLDLTEGFKGALALSACGINTCTIGGCSGGVATLKILEEWGISKSCINRIFADTDILTNPAVLNGYKELKQICPPSPLLAEHRHYLRNYQRRNIIVNKTPNKTNCQKPIKKSHLEGLETFNAKLPKHALNGLQERTARTSKFKKELILVVEAHKSFVKMLSPKISQITQKEYNYLKTQFPVQLWRIAWNTANEWAIVPTEENPIWEDMYQPIPPNNQKKAQQKRKNALIFLANKLNQIILEFPKLLAPNSKYTMERNFNSLFREIFNAIVNNPIIDENINNIPKGKNKYAQSFNEYSPNVQEIIRKRARKKYNFLKRKKMLDNIRKKREIFLKSQK